MPVSRGSEHWLIVPLQYAIAGSPPLETWLDSYLRKTLQVPYYVGLLSAAEVYGASPYAVMVTQVMVEHRRRTVIVGRHEIVFHTRTRIETMPTRWHETADGRFRVSTPELTVSLEGPLPAAERPAGTINANFKVWIPDTLEGANT